MLINKYDIISINLNPKKWHAQAWIRPCVVIQSNIFNKYSSTIIVIPLTTSMKKIFPSEFLIIPSKSNWLHKESRFLWSQIITVDKKFFVEKIGTLESDYYFQIKEAVWIALDYDDVYMG